MYKRPRHDEDGIPLRFWSMPLDRLRARMNRIKLWIVRETDESARYNALYLRWMELYSVLRARTHCAYCGEWIGDFHQCAGTLAEDANAQAMRAYTLDERQRREDREATR